MHVFHHRAGLVARPLHLPLPNRISTKPRQGGKGVATSPHPQTLAQAVQTQPQQKFTFLEFMAWPTMVITLGLFAFIGLLNNGMVLKYSGHL
jgi:hypothetical protein